MDATTGQVLAARWEDAETPIPLGSLEKPFAALAYGAQHGFHFPVHTCRGTASGCWRPSGHGKVDLSAAIAYSCNSYFRVLTSDLRTADISTTATRFGLEVPDSEASGVAFAGFGSGWRVSPVRMAQAYVNLLQQKQNPAISQILTGMAQSAQRGTGAAVNRTLQFSRALAKTGTAPCTHLQHAPGDGFTVVLIPADDPKILLMVRVHGVPGAQAANTAGQMLRSIESYL
jgi:cell division protein FtsI/penicillin-binding protein 2